MNPFNRKDQFDTSSANVLANVLVQGALSSWQKLSGSQTDYTLVGPISVGASHLSPVGELPVAQESIMSGFEEIPTHPEQVLNLTMDSQQAWGVGNRFESANLALLLTSVLVRDLGSIVRISILTVNH